jgi:predicted amidophosphoribosyltransferase
LLLRIGRDKRPQGMFADATYRAAKQCAAGGKFGEAKALFTEMSQHHPSAVVRSLAQERNELINRIVSRHQQSAFEDSALAQNVKVKEALRVDAHMLLPEIRYVGCAAAYRSGYDRQKGDALSSLIRLIKKGVDESAIERLGEYLAAFACFETPILADVDFILPVPTHRERETARGYSIPRILAEQVSRRCAIPIHEELMRTSPHALELRHVPRWYRKYAVNGSFESGKRADWVKDQVVLVVDDVLTTGSTVREVARVLHEHDVRVVHAIALAHTERSN